MFRSYKTGVKRGKRELLPRPCGERTLLVVQTGCRVHVVGYTRCLCPSASRVKDRVVFAANPKFILDRHPHVVCCGPFVPNTSQYNASKICQPTGRAEHPTKRVANGTSRHIYKDYVKCIIPVTYTKTMLNV